MMDKETAKHLENFKNYWRTQRIPVIKETTSSPEGSSKKWLDFNGRAHAFFLFHRPSDSDYTECDDEIENIRGELSDALAQAEENYREKQNIRHARILKYIVAGIFGMLGIIIVVMTKFP